MRKPAALPLTRNSTTLFSYQLALLDRAARQGDCSVSRLIRAAVDAWIEGEYGDDYLASLRCDARDGVDPFATEQEVA